MSHGTWQKPAFHAQSLGIECGFEAAVQMFEYGATCVITMTSVFYSLLFMAAGLKFAKLHSFCVSASPSSP